MMDDNVTKHRKRLSTRLFAAFFLLPLFAFFVAATAVVAVSWHVYEGDAEERLVNQTEESASKLRSLSANQMVAELSESALADTRITLINSDGSILYDSYADVSSMANHSNREEVVAARNGSDSIVFRNSETTGADTLYAATAVNDDGVVLRLSETRTSLLYYLKSLIGPLALAALLAVALSALLARVITRKTVSPLLTIDLNTPLESYAYEEVEPLLSRIDTQRNELIAQNEQLEEAMSVRREFTGNVSHEMKSPLQVIGGYAELIERGIPNPEETKRFASLIREEAICMRQLIDDVLLLSKLDEDAFEEPHEVDVSRICLQCIDRLKSVAQARKVRIDVSCPDGMVVFGTDAPTEQIAYNLIENAIRYGNGHVEVCVSKTNDNVVLAVSDDGAGIPDDQRERVFERFYRIDPSRSRDTGGTGLGLAIVKHAAQSMGGTSYVAESNLGGARFVVEIPAANP